MLDHEVEAKGLVARPHHYNVHYRLHLDTKDKLHYRLFSCIDDEGEWLKGRITNLLGASNIVEITTERVEKYYIGVHLKLASDTIENHTEICEVSPTAIEGDLRELLPEEHIVGIQIVSVYDRGGDGWRR